MDGKINNLIFVSNFNDNDIYIFQTGIIIFDARWH